MIFVKVFHSIFGEKILAGGKLKCSLKIHKIFAHFVRVAKVKISTTFAEIKLE